MDGRPRVVVYMTALTGTEERERPGPRSRAGRDAERWGRMKELGTYLLLLLTFLAILGLAVFLLERYAGTP